MRQFFSWIGPCERSRPDDSENVVLFERATFLTGVIAAQRQNMPAKLKASPKLGGVKKIKTATIFWNFYESSGQIQENIFFLDLTRGFVKSPKIVAMFFLTQPFNHFFS